jgi:hypothetical protein
MCYAHKSEQLEGWHTSCDWRIRTCFYLRLALDVGLKTGGSVSELTWDIKKLHELLFTTSILFFVVISFFPASVCIHSHGYCIMRFIELNSLFSSTYDLSY